MLRSLSEVSRFMRKERLASFATVDLKGHPHIVPVFFTYDEGKVHIYTDRESKKFRNLAGNSNVAITVYTSEEAVIIRGKGKVIEDREKFIKRTKEYIEKYHVKLDEQERNTRGTPLLNKEVRCVIEVVPERILFW